MIGQGTQRVKLPTKNYSILTVQRGTEMTNDNDLIRRGAILELCQTLEDEAPSGSYDNGGTIDGWMMACRRIEKAIAAIPAVAASQPMLNELYVRTGVKDRTGREICVGDRILIDISGPSTKSEYWKPEYEVAFKPPHFVIKHVGGDKDSDTAHFYWRVPQKSSTEKIVTLSVAASQPADPVINAGSCQRVVVVEKPDRSTFDAMCAMRNAINEHIPMPSLESDLLQGPENSVFCATVAEAVIKSHIRLKRDLETANYQVERLQSSFNDMARVADDWMHKAEGLQPTDPARVTVKPLVWRDDGTNGHDTDHAFGFYEVYPDPRGDMLSRDGVDSGIFGTIEAAKAAAQADYEARILATIDVPPAPRDAQIAALVEAAQLYIDDRIKVDDTPTFCNLCAAVAAVKGGDA